MCFGRFDSGRGGLEGRKERIMSTYERADCADLYVCVVCRNEYVADHGDVCEDCVSALDSMLARHMERYDNDVEYRERSDRIAAARGY
jgi:hypothetical protein